MIAGIFHKGSGLGNQLARYVATRCIAKDRGYKFGMVNPEGFKAASFMQLDMGEDRQVPYVTEYPSGKVVPNTAMILLQEKREDENGADTRGYDPLIVLIGDETIIDGEFQDEKYWLHRAEEVREWLKVEPLDMPKDVCVINFRGGEFVGLAALYLPKEYWDLAIRYKMEQGIKKFEVHTDDVASARYMLELMLPAGTIFIADMEMNWRAVRYAHHLILSNSSFPILPAWLNENVKEIIAPLFWARRNQGFWSMKQNKYKGRGNWKYI